MDALKDPLAPVHAALHNLVHRARQFGASPDEVVAFAFSPELIRGEPLRVSPFDVGVLHRGWWVCVTSLDLARAAVTVPGAPDRIKMLAPHLPAEGTRDIVPTFVIERQHIVVSSFIFTDGGPSTEDELFSRAMLAAAQVAAPKIAELSLDPADTVLDMGNAQFNLCTRQEAARRYEGAPEMRAGLLAPIPAGHIRGVVRMAPDFVAVGDFPLPTAKGGSA